MACVAQRSNNIPQHANADDPVRACVPTGISKQARAPLHRLTAAFSAKIVPAMLGQPQD
jgi:hypothetical protein